MEQISRIYKDSLQNKHIADEYYESRQLQNKTSGYLHNFTHNNIQYQNQIIIPIYDTTNNLVSLETRSLTQKEHFKLKSSQAYYPIYNIHNAIKNTEYVVITEGIFDCDSLLQYGINAVSTTTASVTKPVLHLLAIFDLIIVVFDTDDVGIRQTKEILKFYQTYYPHINTDTICYWDKDINQALINGNMENIVAQIKEIVRNNK